MADDGIEVQPARLDQLASRKSQELTGESGRLVCRLGDLIEVLEPRIVWSEGLRQEIAEPQDCHQHVVEIVGNATRKSSYCLQPYNLLQALLCLLPLSDVEQNAAHAEVPA